MAGKHILSNARYCVLIALAACLAACSAARPEPPEFSPLAGQPSRQIARVDLLRVSPGMKGFTAKHAAAPRAGQNKAWALAYAAMDPWVLDFTYDPAVTLTAEEAFEARRGNCLTFSGLLIAMAREAGLDAWYQEIEIPANWSNVNDTLLVSMHVNAVLSDGGKNITIDVSGREQQKDDVARRLSDEEAEAQFYNNLGADALVENDLPTAFAWFRLALEVEPGLAYVWSNLGVVYRRNGQTGDAIRAYRHALDINPKQSVALNNLYLIYEEVGDLESAAEMERRVERNRRRNPWYLYHLAEVALEEQRYDDAVQFLDKAIKMHETEYRFHYALAQSQYHAGKAEDAQNSLARAKALAPQAPEGGPLILPDPSF